MIETKEEHKLDPNTWLGRFGDYLYGYARLRVRNTQVAEDLVQDTLLAALRARQGFKGHATEKTWLTAILKNKIIDHYRKENTRQTNDTYLTETEKEWSDTFYQNEGTTKGWMKPEATFMDWAPLPDEQLQQRETQSIIDKCLSKLPPKLAPIFISKYIDDRNTDEICSDFGISTNNYWIIIHRAKISLRACLEKQNLFVKS